MTPNFAQRAKFVIFSKVIDRNFRRSIEEYKTVAKIQEGFRANRSTKRKISKLQCLVTSSYYLCDAVS